MQKETMQSLRENSCLEGGNLEYIESLYEAYLTDPNTIGDDWRKYFDALPNGKSAQDVSIEEVREHFKKAARSQAAHAGGASCSSHDLNEIRVAELINAYRAYGHHRAVLDPLSLSDRHELPSLSLTYHGLDQVDMNESFQAGGMIGLPGSSLKNITSALEKTYCGTIGVEYMHITDTKEIDWLQSKMEPVQNHPPMTTEEKKKLLGRLTAAEGLEKYLGTKYVGQKRFSLEGGESLIPLMKGIVHESAAHDVKECIIGMAHRGRLNVLVNLLGKSPDELFAEFEGKLVIEKRTGDVKYHKGFSSDIQLKGKSMHLALAFNPSHLEIVAPVVEGSVRARQRRSHDKNREHSLPIIIHGDAAIAGQGVVMETFNFSQSRGFCTGGTVHIVVNNQVGFTTSNPLDSRSTLYCTDIAKMVQAPIFHVNADDPEAVMFVAKLASQYRAEFHKDVMIDLVCYRRQGHNEADDPSITQPVMYGTIRQLPTTRKLYADKLVAEGIITAEEESALVKGYIGRLESGKPVVKIAKVGNGSAYAPNWEKYMDQSLDAPVNTGVPIDKLKALATSLETLPEDFNVHRQVQRLLDERRKMTAGEAPVNWGYAETLAYATIVNDNHPVRLCGQDAGRGTFAHRHATLHDAKTRKEYTPLSHIRKDQAPFIVIDSVLSEEAVLAFEYGYATADPDALVIWEAQFGDFANGAQVVIDQFISSGEQKWNRLCGLTMLLPHGYEGMGPEHSSARLERYLQLCAQQNMQVCVPSTPAQIFHLLRRQILRLARKPLIIMSPKSFLRHKLAVSSLEDLADGQFHLVIPEIDEDIKADKVMRVIMCSGKVYYDLLEKRREEKMKDVAIVRIEQQYPFPRTELSTELAKYPNAKDVVWCQEEPKNQGAWYQIFHHLEASLQDWQVMFYAGRKAMAAPAVGYAGQHKQEQIDLVNEALGIKS